MKKSLKSALLWNESYLWGIWLYKALNQAEIEVEPVLAEDLSEKFLEKYQVLFVPGGWASNKLQALGEKGKELIRKFVKDGGIYFGICGGAGLATCEGLGLVKIKRKKDRVPGFSGPIKVRLNPHLLWQGIKKPEFFLWWPSEFLIEDQNIKVLASFEKALPEAFSSDLSVKDFQNQWEELENLYEIKLNPERMKGSPLVVEGVYGKGKAFLSLIHFDTPYDKRGIKVFKNFARIFNLKPKEKVEKFKISYFSETQERLKERIKNFYQKSKELITLGERNFLFFRRYPFIYQWRRGIRGLEYFNLYIVLKEIKKLISSKSLSKEDLGKISQILEEVKEDFNYFYESSKKLLPRERIALNFERLTYNQTKDKALLEIREKLFGLSKSYGGLYKKILGKLDQILYLLINSPTTP